MTDIFHGIVSESFDPLPEFKYNIILMDTGKGLKAGNMLGEAVITNHKKFNLRRIKNTGKILPLLKYKKEGSVWDHMSEFLGIPKEIAISLFNFNELAWQILVESRADYSPQKRLAMLQKVSYCKEIWVSFGFLPVTTCKVQSTRQVQQWNIQRYINLRKSCKRDLITLTKKTLLTSDL